MSLLPSRDGAHVQRAPIEAVDSCDRVQCRVAVVVDREVAEQPAADGPVQEVLRDAGAAAARARLASSSICVARASCAEKQRGRGGWRRSNAAANLRLAGGRLRLRGAGGAIPEPGARG